MTLTEFLLARITDDEAMAREAVPSTTTWSVGYEAGLDRRSVVAHLVIPDDSVDNTRQASDEVARTRWPTSAQHMARWDPARVLIECEAKRRIVATFVEVVADGPGKYSEVGLVAQYLELDVLRVLALPYADHPDFDPSWRV